MILLKDYQDKAVKDLLTRTQALLPQSEIENKTIVFQSPTGSGKTVMMAKYIESLVNNEYADTDICFLWISVGKGDLHIQSKRSLERYFDGYPSVSLYEDEYTSGKERLDMHSVTVVNWEKLRTKDRTTKEWKNKLMKEASDFMNFSEVLETTREDGKVIMIIDESHLGMDAERTVELRNIIQADITIEVSATPKLLPTLNQMAQNAYQVVRIPSEKVIEEGMIKKEIIINAGLENLKTDSDENTSEKLVLDAAYKKRLEIKAAYESEKVRINPLVIIQLPNSDAGIAKRESVEQFLAEKDITVANGKLAIWLNEDKTKDIEKITENKHPVEYLLFKQAIDTGWDCPRAGILVKFRDIKSETFEIQTVGRILRMPEQKHYTKEEMLNSGYVYTNIKEILVKKEEYNPNIIKTQYAYKRVPFTNLVLRSYYRKRTDFGVITSSYYAVFNKYFSSRFSIDTEGVVDTIKNFNILTEQHNLDVKLNRNKTDISDEGKIETKIFDTLGNNEAQRINTEVLETKQADHDTQARFDEALKNLVSGYAVRDSVATLKKAIYDWFEKYLGYNASNNGIVYIQNIFLRESNKASFETAISETIEHYEPIRQAEVKAKTEEEHYDWSIPQSAVYNMYTEEKFETETSFLYPCFLNTKRSEPEKGFEEFLNQNENKIEWWYKNGESKREYFGIRYEKNNMPRTFYPDYIVKMRDGRTGIFDTKQGRTAEDAKEKADALQAFIKKWNEAGANLYGGIIVKDKRKQLRINQNENYAFFQEDLRDWVYLVDDF